jgi:hypothetical protein
MSYDDTVDAHVAGLAGTIRESIRVALRDHLSVTERAEMEREHDRPVLRYDEGDIADTYCGVLTGEGEFCDDKAGIVGGYYVPCAYHLMCELRSLRIALAMTRSDHAQLLERWAKLDGQVERVADLQGWFARRQEADTYGGRTVADLIQESLDGDPDREK